MQRGHGGSEWGWSSRQLGQQAVSCGMVPVEEEEGVGRVGGGWSLWSHKRNNLRGNVRFVEGSYSGNSPWRELVRKAHLVPDFRLVSTACAESLWSGPWICILWGSPVSFVYVYVICSDVLDCNTNLRVIIWWQIEKKGYTDASHKQKK